MDNSVIWGDGNVRFVVTDNVCFVVMEMCDLWCWNMCVFGGGKRVICVDGNVWIAVMESCAVCVDEKMWDVC